MAIRTNWFTMDGKAGVNLNAAITSVTITANPSQPEYPGIPHSLGDRVQGTNGSEWVFVRASATISCFNVVAIDSNYNATNMTTALLASGLYHPAIAETQIAGSVTSGNANGGVISASDFFWAMTKCVQGGRVNANVSATISPGGRLYISGVDPGHVTAIAPTSAAPGGGRLNGMMAITSLDSASVSAPAALEIGMFSYILPGVHVSAYPISTTA